MATYTLIQDIEAEDKILGPLTLRQFIFALIATFLFYINFLVLTKGAWFLMVIFLPPALFFGFFAIPFGRDQSTEIWALAKLRYYLKPRKRVWNQSGVKELVTITAPKKVEHVYTNGLSQTEVKSRLTALANTIDSRGWAVKNVNLNAYSIPSPVMAGSSDRLLDPGAMPQAVPETDIVAADDMLDETSNPVARQFDSMITELSQAHRQELIDQLEDRHEPQATAAKPEGQPADYWFMDQSGGTRAAHSGRGQAPPAPVAVVDPAEEAALASELKARSSDRPTPYGHLRTVKTKPGGTAPAKPAPVKAPAKAVTPQPDPAILSLANNDDFNVSTLAHEAKRARGGDDSDEVVVSLR